MEKVLKKLGGRKVIMTTFVFIVTTVLMIVGTINETDFAQIIKTLLIIYPVANVSQKLLPTTVVESANYPVGKKFIINISVYSVIAILTGFQVLSSETYLSITIWLVGLYNASNVTSKIDIKS